MKPTPNYQEENLRRKKAIEEEERFLKRDVIGQGVDAPTSHQNLQSDMEQALEDDDRINE